MGPITVGMPFPEFTLPDQNGKPFSSNRLRGKRCAIFFYPKDNTPGCTREVCAFRDAWSDLLERGIAVVGISSDSANSHGKFATKHRLPYPLLSDVGGVLRKKVGVPRALLGLLLGRVTYLLDEKGVVRHIIDSPFQIERHVQETLAFWEKQDG